MTTTANISQERLSLLYEISKTINSSLDADEILRSVMDATIDAIGAERGFLMLFAENHELEFRVAHGIDRSPVDDPHVQVSMGLIEAVARKGEPVLTSNALVDPRFSGRESVMSLGLRSILCTPLSLKEQILGVIYLENRVKAGIFQPADLDFLTAIASSAAIAIENARLYRIAVEKARLERELRMARSVQASLLPVELPDLPGWNFAVRWIPAEVLAGDFYDFIPTRSGRLALAIGDVTDHGLPASLFMVFSRSSLRSAVRRSGSPAEAINMTNQVICDESHQGLYTTLFYGELDPESGMMICVSAGHNPILHYRAASDSFEVFNPTGLPLGVDYHAHYGQRQARLQAGDFLLLYTDGITEAIDPDARPFGQERLHQVLRKHAQMPPEQIIAAIEQAVHDFTQAAHLEDDITLMIVKRSGGD